MNWKWRREIIRDWTVFLWDRFPQMYVAEIHYRMLVLLEGPPLWRSWNRNHRLTQRISNIGDNFALYMTLKREQILREANPDCWGGETFDESD